MVWSLSSAGGVHVLRTAAGVGRKGPGPVQDPRPCCHCHCLCPPGAGREWLWPDLPVVLLPIDHAFSKQLAETRHARESPKQHQLWGSEQHPVQTNSGRGQGWLQQIQRQHGCYQLPRGSHSSKRWGVSFHQQHRGEKLGRGRWWWLYSLWQTRPPCRKVGGWANWPGSKWRKLMPGVRRIIKIEPVSCWRRSEPPVIRPVLVWFKIGPASKWGGWRGKHHHQQRRGLQQQAQREEKERAQREAESTCQETTGCERHSRISCQQSWSVVCYRCLQRLQGKVVQSVLLYGEYRGVPSQCME